MLVYVVPVGAALLIPLLTLGSYKRLIETKLHWVWLLGAGLLIQLGLEWFTLPHRYWHNVGWGLLIASYVLILAFAARNLVLRGMSIVVIGIACNALVITLNHGMPMKVPLEWRTKSWTEPTLKHHPRDHDDKLVFLSDIIILRHPFDNVMSFGDLILSVGLCDVAFNASRNPKRGKKKAQRAVARMTARS